MNNTYVQDILAISLVLLLSPHFSKLFRLPTAPIEIIIGSVLAFFTIIDINNTHFELIAYVGFLYLMFLAGLEVNLKSIAKMPRLYIVQSIYFLGIMWGLSLVVGFVLDLHIILVILLPLISIGILATLSQEYGKELRWIKIAFLVGTIGEVLSIVVLTVFEAATEVGFGEELFKKILLLIVFLGVISLLYFLFRTLFWWYPEIKNILMPSKKAVDGKYQDLRLAMGIFFIMIALMMWLHLELAFGSFIAGLFISTFFHHKKELESQMSSFGFGFLVPLFFIHVGASFDLSKIIDSAVLLVTLQLLVLMFSIRLIAAFILSFIISKGQAVLVAMALSMPLTLMIAVATVGHTHGDLNDTNYYAVVLTSLFEVIIAMLVIKILAKSNLDNKISENRY